jgi:hypothetical protein
MDAKDYEDYWIPDFFIDPAPEIEGYLLGNDEGIYDKDLIKLSIMEGPYDLSTKEGRNKWIDELEGARHGFFYHQRGKSYVVIDDKWIELNKLFARYFFPSTYPPAHPYWNNMKIVSNGKGNNLEHQRWAHPPPQKGTKLNQRYISQSGKAFKLRIANQKYNNNFATLEAALAERKKLCGF